MSDALPDKMVEGGNGDAEEQEGLIVKVAPWKLFIQAWLQKLFATIISVKTLVMLLSMGASWWLITHVRVVDQVVGEAIVKVNQPYITGEQWVSLMTTTVVAYIGARVAPQLIVAVAQGAGQVINSWHSGKVSRKTATTNGNGKTCCDEDGTDTKV